jgi:hypothetical protein
MVKTLEGIWPYASVLILVAVILCLAAFPTLVAPLSLAAVVVSFGMAVIFTVQKNRTKGIDSQGQSTAGRGNLALDLIGLTLSTAAALAAAGMCAQWTATMTRTAQPILSALAAVLAAIPAAIITALIVRFLWGKLTRVFLKQTAG